MTTKTQKVKKSLLKTLKVDSDVIKEIQNKKSDNGFDNDQQFDDDESLDSDEELQLAFAQGKLKPGLVIPVEKKTREFINNEEGLQRKLNDLYLKMDWTERLDVTTPAKPTFELDQLNVANAGTAGGAAASANTEDLANNDFKRESLFFKQAQIAASIAVPRLAKYGILTKRPEDYFAEMAKSDEHMKRVREMLLSRHAELERREKIRKLRNMKKMGKQIQVEAEKKKKEDKKKFMEAVKKKQKKGGNIERDLDIELDEELQGRGEKKSKKRRERDDGDDAGDERPVKKSKEMKKPGKKTLMKDKKYGFGGRKKRSKYNTKESYSEAFNAERSTAGGKGGGKGGRQGGKGGRQGGKGGRQGGKGGFGKKNDKKFANKNKPKRKFK